jgi:hypothetical protein
MTLYRTDIFRGGSQFIQHDASAAIIVVMNGRCRSQEW